MIRSCHLDEVTLMDHDAAVRRQLVKQYIVNFELDRLLHTFRLNAGLPSHAKPLGGWEAENCGLRGHFVGHFLSACSKLAYADGDSHLKLKAKTIVDVLEGCAQPNGYLSAFEEGVLDVLEQEEDRNVWAPYYTLHKIIQGLIDCHRLLGNAKALTLALGLAHYINRRFERLSSWKIDGILRCTKLNPANEFGGIGDSFYTLYDLTGDASLLRLAHQFDRDYFISPLASGEDVLSNLHANTHLPMIISAMHRYEITGEEKYKLAAMNFYHFLLGRTFANGNNSSRATHAIQGAVSEKSEHWGAYSRLDNSLTGGESESCCAHNTERIVERLFYWTQGVNYLDHLESLKYNAILNSTSSETGLSQYHQPMGSGACKTFSEPYDTFWCCTASGIEAMSELQKNIWFKGTDTLLLNAFISSTLYWKEKEVEISQQTAFPDSLTSTLVISTKHAAAFTLMLKESTIVDVKINSSSIEYKRESGFILIERVFHDQDTIQIEISAPLRFVPLQGNERLVAVMYGNVLLAQLGSEQKLVGISKENLLSRFVKCEKNQLEFVLTDDLGHKAAFKPLFRIEQEQYSVYLDLAGRSSHKRRFMPATDGSAAYEQA